MYAALTPTAGNVLFTGDLDGNFLVLDARNGKTLYSFNTGGPIAGGIVTYEQKGRQYVAVATRQQRRLDSAHRQRDDRRVRAGRGLKRARRVDQRDHLLNRWRTTVTPGCRFQTAFASVR